MTSYEHETYGIAQFRMMLGLVVIAVSPVTPPVCVTAHGEFCKPLRALLFRAE